MSGRPADLEGLPWPEGDPDGLSATAHRAAAFADQVEGHGLALVGYGDPLGWSGAAQASFAGAGRAQAASARRTGAAFRTAAGALSHLARVVSDAQETVRDAASRLHDAREAADKATRLAGAARTAANDAHRDAAAASIADGGALAIRAQQAETTAQGLEGRAATARLHAQDVQGWAIRRAEHAVAEVQREDRSVASQLESVHLAGGPGYAPATAPGGLATLGRELLGPAADGDASLVSWLASPPPPPPPPPPPSAHHHSGLLAAGLFIATGALTVADVVQLGLDPATDAATVAVGGEALAEAGALDVAEGSAVAAESATAEGATAAEGAAAEGAAAEGATGEGAASGALDEAAQEGLTATDGEIGAAPEDRLLPEERWKPEDGTPVLGRLPDTSVARDWPGHEVLNLEPWSFERNRQWIQSIVEQRGTAYVGSPEEGNLWNVARNEPTVFARELQWLEDAGYRRVGDYMVPPDA
jgi:hypothetical protein